MPWIKEARSLPLIEYGTSTLLSLVPKSMMPEGLETVLPAEGGDASASYDRLLSPTPKGAAQEETSGYNDGERNELNRLFEAEN